MTERTVETAERIAVLELEVKMLKESVDETNEKLDQLLELKSKGMGAVWLAGLLLSSGLVGFISWAKGLF